jgi:hypothetical protein
MHILLNPLMPYKHLHPRTSGLITYGGGGGADGATAAEVNSSVAGGVSSVNANTNTGFASAKTYGQGQFDALGGKVSDVGTDVDALGGQISGVGGDVTTGFSSLNDYLEGQFDKGLTERSRIAQNQLTGFKQLGDLNKKGFGDLGQDLTTVGGDVTKGFGDQTARFDTLDRSVGGVQTTADNIQTDVGSVQTAVDNGAIANQKAFGTAATNLDTLAKDTTQAFTDAQTNRTTNQGVLTENQGTLGTDLTTLSDNQDTYYDDVAGSLTEAAGKQDTFQTNFDDYLLKYGDDTENNTETTGRIETGLGDFAEEMRGAVGTLGESTVEDGKTLDDVSGEIADLETTVEGGFTTAEDLIGKGFTDATGAQGTSNLALLDAIGAAGDNSAVTGLLSTLGSNVNNLSADFLTQFGGLASAFTTTGDLIKNSVAANGDVIERTLDAQGNVIESRFDAQGTLIGTTETNINSAIAAAQAELGAGQQGLMSDIQGAQQTQMDALGVQIASGFDAQTGQMNTQVGEMAGLASQMTDLDMGMRQEFFQMEGAFDDTGALISQEVTDQGVTIRRNIDQNGNLMIQKFDQQGQAIGNKVFNINEALAQLAGLGTLPGASVSMGNLSPALQASPNGETNVPTGGFMAPFSMTV